MSSKTKAFVLTAPVSEIGYVNFDTSKISPRGTAVTNFRSRPK